MQNELLIMAEQTPTYQKKTHTLLSLKNIDKSNWEKVKLGEVCEEIAGRMSNPQKSTFTKFIGLEHFISGDLRIKNYSTTEGLISTMKTFKKGDILFARRNAYLKRVSLVNFDGICSGDAIVLRSKKDKISNLYTPILLNTDIFLDYAIANANGSTSTRVKFRDLAKFSFLLPPLPFQEQFSALLWDIETQIDHATQVENDLKALKKGLLNAFFEKNEGEKVLFTEIANCISQQVKPKETELDIYIGLEHLEPENLRITNFGKPSDVQGVKLKAKKGDVIFGKRRAYQKKVAICEFDAIVSAHSMILRANTEKVNVDFLPYFMQSDEFMDRAVAISEGSLSPTIKWKVLANQEFYIPLEKEKQKQIAELLKNFDTQLAKIKALKSDLQALKKGLINEIIA